MHCRACRATSFKKILDLGATPPADAFLSKAQLAEPETYYPLVIVLCERCGLVQLNYTVPREQLYPNDYPYVSSTTETGRRHYREMASGICDRFDVRDGLAVDIGSNVGVLLDGFKQVGLRVLGIEPVPKIARMASMRGIETINEFFSEQLASEIIASRGNATVITGTNVIAHIDDLYDLGRGIQKLLAPNGLFVFEAPYLGDLIEKLEYDTVYHEHLSYLSLQPMMLLFGAFNLQLVHVERYAIHGGTLRYYFAHLGAYTVDESVDQVLNDESDVYGRLDYLQERVLEHRAELTKLLYSIKSSGKRVVAVSAPAKGMTLLNYCGLGSSILDYATEKAELKIGRWTPGVRLPVVPDSILLSDMPDYALLLAWNFASEIMQNMSEYAARGGQFIIPIPNPRVVSDVRVDVHLSA